MVCPKWCKDFFERVRHFLLSQGGFLLASLGNLFLGLPAIFSINTERIAQSLDKLAWNLKLGLVLTVAGIFFGLLKEQKLIEQRKLLSTIDDLEEGITNLIKEDSDAHSYYLKMFMKDLGIDQDPEYRASLYAEDLPGTFQLFGRHSDNPDYCNRARRLYKRGGLIYSAWTNNVATLSIEPEPASNEYIKKQMESGLTKADAQSLKMKSRHYYAFCIRKKSDKLAVLMLETTNKTNPFREDWHKQKNVEEPIDRLTRLVVKSENCIPKPSTAAKAGF